MTKEKFKELVYGLEEYNEIYDKLNDLGIDALGSKYVAFPQKLFDHIMREGFGDAGLDTLLWWLYEDVEHVVFNEDGSVYANLDNIEDLYDYLVKNKGNNVDPEILSE